MISQGPRHTNVRRNLKSSLSIKYGYTVDLPALQKVLVTMIEIAAIFSANSKLLIQEIGVLPYFENLLIWLQLIQLQDCINKLVSATKFDKLCFFYIFVFCFVSFY